MSDYGDGYLTPEDAEREQAYFQFISELAIKNSSRYESQAQELVSNRKINLTLQNVPISYKLSRIGCSFSVSEDGGTTFEEISWVRTGWRKSKKQQYLSEFFAQCETSVLFKEK